MPRIKQPATIDRFNIRLDPETADYYRRQAQARRMSVSAYLRRTLIEGVITENVNEIEQRLQNIVSTISSTQNLLSDELALSILISEMLLTAIVEARDPQQLYEAQDRAKQKLQQLKVSKDI